MLTGSSCCESARVGVRVGMVESGERIEDGKLPVAKSILNTKKVPGAGYLQHRNSLTPGILYCMTL